MGLFDKIFGKKQTQEEFEKIDEKSKTVSIEDTTSQDSDIKVNENLQVDDSKNDKPLDKYDDGLESTKDSFTSKLNRLFANFVIVDEEFFDALEETLIQADVGYETSVKLVEELKEDAKLKGATSPKKLQRTVVEKLVSIYDDFGANNLLFSEDQNVPTIIMFVGVNGAGKTTTVGKLTKQLKNKGKSVRLIAADTFRAGATQQLIEWGNRNNVAVTSGEDQADPASVVYAGLQDAKQDNNDVILIDTSGRLQNKVNLMNQLDKIKRIIKREYENAPHEVLLVLDATTGQNAINQAKEFKNVADVSGIVLSKLDGSASGGIIFAIKNETNIPVKLVGLGEGIDDLAKFDPERYVKSVFTELMEGYQ